LDVKDRQLEVKDQQIEHQVRTITQLTEAPADAQQTAAAAQALHAGTMKQQLLCDKKVNAQSNTEKEPKSSWFKRWFG